jgi:plastocyanin
MRQASRVVFVLTAVLGLAAAGCGGDDNGPTGPGPGGGGTADVTVSILAGAMNAGANAYSPDTAVVQVGQTIKWTNNDTMAHTATADAGSFNTGTIGGGSSSNVITITGATGVRAYHCAISGHNMQGWVNVTP